MSPAPSTPSEITPGPDVVTQLLCEQASHLAHLPVRASSTSGSSNWVFRLGDTLAVRLPRSDGYVSDLFNEVHWIPRPAAKLPVPVPTVVAVGDPTEHFPRPWTVVSWVPGDLPVALNSAQQDQFARTFGRFLLTLHDVETGGAPAGAAHWVSLRRTGHRDDRRLGRSSGGRSCRPLRPSGRSRGLAALT